MIKTPKSLHEEHAELRQFAASLARQDGESGEAARRLQRVLETHFQKEENFAAPPLGLLPQLARGNITPGMSDALAHGDWLRRNLETMIAEHRMIAAALEDVLKAAGKCATPELVSFAEALLNHSRLEEEVLYPAAIVASEYLKVLLGERAAIVAV